MPTNDYVPEGNAQHACLLTTILPTLGEDNAQHACLLDDRIECPDSW